MISNIFTFERKKSPMLARTILFVLLLTASFASAQEWELLRTPAVHGFTEMTHDGGTLYAVADREYGIFSSQDNGITWQPRWPGLRMYVAQGKYYRVERDTVHRLLTSDNQGLTWQDEGALPVPINQFPPHLTISAQGDVYCYIRDIVFRRLAGQSSWQSIHNQPNETVRAAHIYGDHIWVQTDVKYPGLVWRVIPCFVFPAAKRPIRRIKAIPGNAASLHICLNASSIWVPITAEFWTMTS